MDKSIYVCQLDRDKQEKIEKELRRVIKCETIMETDALINCLLYGKVSALDKYIDVELL